MIVCEKEDFLGHLSQYQFITESGALNLEEFCFTLANCFYLDNISNYPSHHVIYDYSLECIGYFLNTLDHIDIKIREEGIYRSKVLNWEPSKDFLTVYPNKYTTFIHISALVGIHSYWLYNIGHSLLDIPEPKQVEKYFGWARSFVATNIFLTSFHDKLFLFMKEFDKKNDTSLFETLYTSIANNEDFDRVKKDIKKRNDIYKDDLDKINKAISDGYLREAIVKEENLISHCLKQFISKKKLLGNSQLPNDLFKLIKVIKKSNFDNIKLTLNTIDELNSWRRLRNNEVHNTIENRLHYSDVELNKSTKKTAEEGLILCIKIVQWYKEESADFLEHRFSE